ncbi:hypothetical protein Tco_0715982 [Tanacetum coccineum]
MDKRWTNEKHLCFLRSVEASFVRTLLENGDGRVPAMDRILPDSCESTLDSKCTTKRNKRYRGGISMDQKVIRRLRIHPYLSFQEDQVVPQMKRLKNEANEENGTCASKYAQLVWELHLMQDKAFTTGTFSVEAAQADKETDIQEKDKTKLKATKLSTRMKRA